MASLPCVYSHDCAGGPHIRSASHSPETRYHNPHSHCASACELPLEIASSMISRSSLVTRVRTESEQVLEESNKVLRIGEEGIRGDDAILCFFRRVNSFQRQISRRGYIVHRVLLITIQLVAIYLHPHTSRLSGG
jgi:hypothetical protein